MTCLLTSETARRMLDERRPSSVRVSLDLGLTEDSVRVDDRAAVFPGGAAVPLDALRRAARDDASIFAVTPGGLEKVSLFCEQTNRHYKLHPTRSWPALVISGVTMHRIGQTDPRRDVQRKLRLLAPIRGRVLDTCCGLGYTAIGAARTAEHVITVEKDPNVLEIARLNPHSRALFEHPRLELRLGDARDEVAGFPEAAFDVVIHDPPTLSLAGELYSDELYAHLRRVLRPRGRLLHYTGAPGSRRRGIDLPRRVARRLASAGFVGVRRDEPTGSLVAAAP